MKPRMKPTSSLKVYLSTSLSPDSSFLLVAVTVVGHCGVLPGAGSVLVPLSPAPQGTRLLAAYAAHRVTLEAVFCHA